MVRQTPALVSICMCRGRHLLGWCGSYTGRCPRLSQGGGQSHPKGGRGSGSDTLSPSPATSIVVRRDLSLMAPGGGPCCSPSLALRGTWRPQGCSAPAGPCATRQGLRLSPWKENIPDAVSRRPPFSTRLLCPQPHPDPQADVAGLSLQGLGRGVRTNPRHHCGARTKSSALCPARQPNGTAPGGRRVAAAAVLCESEEGARLKGSRDAGRLPWPRDLPQG